MSLSGNTAKINELLSKINALPEAGSGGGSGGGVETCTVTVTSAKYAMPPEGTVYYTGENFTTQQADYGATLYGNPLNFTVPKGTLIVFSIWSADTTTTNAEKIFQETGFTVFHISGDATIKCNA